MSVIPMQKEKILRGNFAYQQRQQRRQNYLEKKRALRKTFELGKLVEKAGLQDEDQAVIYEYLLSAKKTLQQSSEKLSEKANQ